MFLGEWHFYSGTLEVLAYMTKRDLKSLVLPLFTIVLGKNFSMTKNLLSLRLSSHH